MSYKPVLLVEDDIVDSMTVKRVFSELEVNSALDVVVNGEEALDYLEKNPAPCIILLDLNMPKMNGMEFLELFRKKAEYDKIPVIIITTSQEEKDKISSLKLDVSGYIVKPIYYIEFKDTLHTLLSDHKLV